MNKAFEQQFKKAFLEAIEIDRKGVDTPMEKWCFTKESLAQSPEVSMVPMDDANLTNLFVLIDKEVKKINCVVRGFGLVLYVREFDIEIKEKEELYYE